jgi:hypothetical protein
MSAECQRNFGGILAEFSDNTGQYNPEKNGFQELCK